MKTKGVVQALGPENTGEKFEVSRSEQEECAASREHAEILINILTGQPTFCREYRKEAKPTVDSIDKDLFLALTSLLSG